MVQFLADLGVDFSHNARNHAGNTPLSKAVAHARLDVVEWLLERAKEETGGSRDEGAAALAAALAVDTGDPVRREIAGLLDRRVEPNAG